MKLEEEENSSYFEIEKYYKIFLFWDNFVFLINENILIKKKVLGYFERNFLHKKKKRNYPPPLYFLHYSVNLSILLTEGKEIKRDSISSGERRSKRSKVEGGSLYRGLPLHLLSRGWLHQRETKWCGNICQRRWKPCYVFSYYWCADLLCS